MVWVLLALFLTTLCFGFVVFFGAPYVPTLTKQMNIALDFMDLQKGQTMLELGCGDGKVLIAAAERGWKVVGYELNPILALVAYLRTRRYGSQVRVVCSNFWMAKWPVTDGVYGFILPKYMKRLNKKVMQECSQPVKVVSFAFVIPNKKPVRVKDSVFLYQF